MALDLIEELDRVVAAFDQRAVEYALGGWLASSIHRWPSSTGVAEILVAEASLPAAVCSAASVGYGPSEISSDRRDRHHVSKVDRETEDRMTFDLRAVTVGLTTVWSRRVRANWRGRVVTLVSRDGLAGAYPSNATIASMRASELGPRTRRLEPPDLSDEAISRRLERVRALYRLNRSLRDARILSA